MYRIGIIIIKMLIKSDTHLSRSNIIYFACDKPTFYIELTQQRLTAYYTKICSDCKIIERLG